MAAMYFYLNVSYSSDVRNMAAMYFYVNVSYTSRCPPLPLSSPLSPNLHIITAFLIFSILLLKAVVTSLTRAIDAAVILRDVTWTYSWFEIIENETMDQADALDEGLQDVKIALIRLDMRITEAIDGSKKLKNFFESLDGVYMYEVMDKVGPQINES